MMVRSGPLRRSFSRMLAGTGTITFDQAMRLPKLAGSDDALASDWRAVGDDLRRSMRSIEQRPAD